MDLLANFSWTDVSLLSDADEGEIDRASSVVIKQLEPVPKVKNSSARFSVDHEQQPQVRKQLRRFHGGWRTGVLWGLSGTFAVSIINISALAWVYAKFKAVDGIVTVYEGSCTETTRISTWSHLTINVLSTLMLGASNLGMQCLSAPTRSEVDIAHLNGSWLSIGVPNVRNLFSCGGRRLTLWIVLALSSTMLHLLYNSVLYTTSSTSDYTAILVAPSFVFGSSLNISNPQIDYNHKIENLLSSSASLTRLEHYDCLQTYNTTYLSGFADVVIVSNVTFPSPKNCSVYSAIGQQFHVQESLDSVVLWYNVWTQFEYCLAQPSLYCKVSMVRPILWIVVICNIAKILCLLFLLLLPEFRPLITVGDVISSFLCCPDESTMDIGVICTLDLQQAKAYGMTKHRSLLKYVPPRKTFKMHRYRWFKGASRRCWFYAVSLTLMYWVFSLVLLLIGYLNEPGSISTGFGATNLKSIISLSLSLTSNILISNSPQVIFSLNYLLYNSLFTSMLLTAEVNSFVARRKTLRVSNPRGDQRSTYYLQLPYRYAVPLMVLSGWLHWLISQSIFLVNVSVFDMNGTEDPSRAISGCGWSGRGLVATLCVGAIMMAMLFGVGSRKYHSGMPIMTSCSQAISAACHPPPGDADAAFQGLMYGVTIEMADRCRYVGFSSQEVRPLAQGDSLWTEKQPKEKDAYQAPAVCYDYFAHGL